MVKDEINLTVTNIFLFESTLRVDGKLPAIGSLEIAIFFHQHRSVTFALTFDRFRSHCYVVR